MPPNVAFLKRCCLKKEDVEVMQLINTLCNALLRDSFFLKLLVKHFQFDSSRVMHIWILGTPISSVGRSISNETFDKEYVDIECSFDIDVFYIRYRTSISKVFDIECHSTRYRR